MREIKFRAWDNEEKWMVDGLYISFDGDIFTDDVDPHDTPYKEMELANAERYELMQFTGLKDANGKEIYEGDVLRDSESIVIVKFVDGEFSVDYRTIGGKWRNYSSLFGYLEDYEGEIIGNIYETPELIERRK